MAVLTHPRSADPFGLRPMNPMRDLTGVANLIEDAFADDLDRSGRTALRELRWLSRLKPLLWWMLLFSGDHTDFLSGFVWEENGDIIGNITISRASHNSRQWLISNVAVARPYRGRGIGRGLMYAAIELAREYNGLSVALQVRANNETARHLYESLDFKQIAGVAYLRLARVEPPAREPFPADIDFRRRMFNATDTRLAYNLATLATPTTTQEEWPLRRNNFRLGNHDRLQSWFSWLVGGGPSRYWVAEHDKKFVGMVNARPAGWQRHHRLELMVHPRWRGRLEQPLLSRGLKYLSQWPGRATIVRHPTSHPEAIGVYKAYGFSEEQTLLWMKRQL